MILEETVSSNCTNKTLPFYRYIAYTLLSIGPLLLMTTQKTTAYYSSIIANITLIFIALQFGLLWPAVVGFVTFIFAKKMMVFFERYFKKTPYSHYMSIALIIAIVSAGLGIIIAIPMSFIGNPDRLPELLLSLAQILSDIKSILPHFLWSYIPDSIQTVNKQIVELLHQYGHQLTTISTNLIKETMQILIGITIGTLIACNKTAPTPMAAFQKELIERFQGLKQACETNLVAQIKISAINTILTAIYLLIVLPIFGVHLPFVWTLVFITFVTGLIPIVGNLLSNTAIIVLSLATSITTGCFSIAFLLVIHKMEYFLNAKIVGQETHTKIWEILIAMLIMEKLFGLSGLIIAPILYTYIKMELKKGKYII